MFKLKSKKLILGILLCICAAFFACGIFAIFNTEDKGQTVTAHAETPVTPTIYWKIDNNGVFTLSAENFSGAQSFSGSQYFNYYRMPWESSFSKIKTVNILTEIAPLTVGYYFYMTGSLVEINNIENINTSNATNAMCLFFQSSITEIDVSNFDTSKITNMETMFGGCRNLIKLDLSNFVIAPNTNLTRMLENLDSLKQISLSDSLATRILETDFFQTQKVAVWYDAEGNEYTQDSPMTTGGTYYSTKQECTHDWQLTSSDPAGCLSSGTEYYTCSKCSKTKTKTETIPAIGSHDWNDWVTTTPATCTAKGVKTRTCKRDSTHTETGDVDMIAHDYNTQYTTDVEATCTTTGTKSKHCKNCTAKTDEQIIPATGHAWGNWSTTTAASCTTAGSEKRVCNNNAAHTETRAVNATGHSYVANVTEPTCTEDGYTTHTCSNCGDEYIDTNVPATGHNWGAPAWQWAANNLTCKAKFTCSNCNKEQLETASVTHNSATASCTVAGDTTYTASVTFNNNTYTDSKVISGQTLPHTWQLLHESVAPDCENDGAGQFECSVCQKQETRAIDKLGHVEVDDAEVPATCTTDGKTAGKHCSRCNKTLDGLNVIPALGHNWTTDWETDTTNHWHECTVCGEKKDDEAHTYDWVITKEPTVDEEGEKEEYCTVCDYANGNKETLAKLVVDDNGSVSDLPTGHDYDLEIAVKESDSLYNIAGITKGYKVELFVVDGEDRTEYDSNKQVTLMLVIPEGMEDEFTLYCRHGEILERVDPATYTVNGKSVTIRTTLPNEYVFNAPAPEEPESGIPWWVWLIVGLVAAAILGIIIIIIVVAKKKKNDNTPPDNGELLQRLDNQDQVLNEILNRGDDGGFNTPVELDENGNVIFK